jgi:hypothetical protein
MGRLVIASNEKRLEVFGAGIDAFCLPIVEDEIDDFGPRLSSLLENRCLDWADLPEENDNGCVEYKWKLGIEHGQSARVARLATQMKFRVREGKGTAFYLIGVRDTGDAPGLSPQEHKDAVCVLMDVAKDAGGALLLEALSEKRKGGRRCSAWRVGAKQPVIAEVAGALHLEGSETISPVPGQLRARANTLPHSRTTNGLGVELRGYSRQRSRSCIR